MSPASRLDALWCMRLGVTFTNMLMSVGEGGGGSRCVLLTVL